MVWRSEAGNSRGAPKACRARPEADRRERGRRGRSPCGSVPPSQGAFSPATWRPALPPRCRTDASSPRGVMRKNLTRSGVSAAVEEGAVRACLRANELVGLLPAPWRADDPRWGAIPSSSSSACDTRLACECDCHLYLRNQTSTLPALLSPYAYAVVQTHCDLMRAYSDRACRAFCSRAWSAGSSATLRSSWTGSIFYGAGCLLLTPIA